MRRLFRQLTAILPLATLAPAVAPLSAFAAESGDGHHGGVPPGADTLFHIGGFFPVTNSMFMSWLVAIAIIAIVKLAIGRRPRLVPTRGQAVIESLLTSLRDILAPIVGRQVIPHAFPLLAAFFIYILCMNWSGLIPGVGSILWDGKELLRPGNADLNGTLALAVVSFGAWLYFVLRYAGLRSLAQHTFGNKADKREVAAPMYIFLTVLFLAVGIIEVVSILFRPVSLAFRLYGNVFGGENLIHQLGGLAPYVVPAAASFLEILIGFIQALVFTLLSAVYIGLICNHDDGHAEAEHGATEAPTHA